MTQTQLADVFLGKITNWSSFCADKQIVTVHRSEPLGTPTLCPHSLLSGRKGWNW